jgi:hypothetical protein
MTALLILLALVLVFAGCWLWMLYDQNTQRFCRLCRAKRISKKLQYCKACLKQLNDDLAVDVGRLESRGR